MRKPDSSPAVRRAIAVDAHAVAECVHAAYSRWIPVIGAVPGPMQQDYREVLLNEQVYVAEADDAVVGVLVLATPEGFLLENVAVHPDFAGGGLGSRLLALAEAEAIAQRHQSIHLYTHERMDENIRRYEQLGYREFARRIEHGLARVYMRKSPA